MAKPREFGRILKDGEKLDKAYDKQVEDRKDFMQIHDRLQRDALKKSGTGVAEASRAISRRAGAKFNE